MKKMMASILTAVIILSTVGVAGCSNSSQKPVLSTLQTQGGTSNRPTVNNEIYGEPYKGTVLRAGCAYEMTSNVAFLSEDLSALSEDEKLEVTLVATVTPADAKQEVSWLVVFVDPFSEWATGKSVEDYVTVTPTEEYGPTATVVCKKAFSEPIKIICTSIWDTSVSTECIVDFVSAFENVSLLMGDDMVNLGGVTDVYWETCETANAGVAWGGDIGVDVTTDGNGTITGYTYRVDLLTPRAWYEQDKLKLRYSSSGLVTEYYGDEGEFIDSGIGGKSLIWSDVYEDGYFTVNLTEYTPVGSYPLGSYQSSTVSMDCSLANEKTTFNNLSAFSLSALCENRIGIYGSRIHAGVYIPDLLSGIPTYGASSGFTTRLAELTEGSLCTVLLTITTASGAQMQYMSLLNLTDFTYTPAVETISLSSTKIKVSYEP